MDLQAQIAANDAQERLRVLFVIPGSEAGMGMPFSRRQLTSLQRLGVTAEAYFLESRTSPLKIASGVRGLSRKIAAFKPDVVHAHFGTMTAFVSAIAATVPLVITFHGSDLNPAPGDPWLRSRLGHLLSRLASYRASQVVCVSSQLTTRLHVEAARVSVIPCGVNLDMFAPMSMHAARNALGWNQTENVVLFNARTDPIGKRLDLAEAAVAVAQQQIPNVRLHVFRGRTPPDQMPVFYNAANCLLMTSDHEGSPMVIKEAMACNLPVVSVDVGDVCERIAGVSLSYVVARNPQKIGEAVIQVLAAEQRSTGREKISELDENLIAKQLVDVYKRTLALWPNDHARAA